MSQACIEPLEQRTHLALLTKADVEGLLARAASQARSKQAIVVSDRDGAILGIFSVGNATKLTIGKAIARARTAAFFQSAENAFTTRTARFIIQDHFPHPVPNTPGGPLYGVEFSSLPGSDVYSGPAISGDPGGIPLFKDGEPVGGIGVAGDGNDIAVREDFRDIPSIKIDNPTNGFFNGVEEKDFDEAVALAGAVGFMAAKLIRADQIFLDGLRLPFIKDKPATGNSTRSLDDLIDDGVGSLKKAGFISPTTPALRGSPGSPFPTAVVAGDEGQRKNPAVAGFGVVGSDDITEGEASLGDPILTAGDVQTIFTNAVKQALKIRAAIRQPIGVAARVHIAVVDRNGDILGVYRMNDATNFSFDVAVQKARTAAYFSDDDHAFSTRAVGFISQRFFPAGINGRVGPLFELQNQLSDPSRLIEPLNNGITIFPGGIPLYKNGQLVGAIGISGDGVDQDDLIAYAGSKGFRPANGIRSDVLGEASIVEFLKDRVNDLAATFGLSDSFARRLRQRLNQGLDDVQLPYVKFPRNPDR